ncbi:MAG: hypothetical protein M3Q75_04010 [Gemmatimonadota bacterium]|nr:hypothetical protein [Gemmatimonadota bacterium]
MWFRIGLALALAACGPAAKLPVEPAQCGPGVPPTAQHPLAMRAVELAGDYHLILVQSQPSSDSKTAGRLHLSPLDSLAKAAAAGGAVRDLTGWLDPADSDSIWPSGIASRDAARPGAVLAGQHLRLGRADYPKGMAHNLTITAVSPRGFWGWWKADRGVAVTTEPRTGRLVPDPAGYFCALRSPE